MEILLRCLLEHLQEREYPNTMRKIVLLLFLAVLVAVPSAQAIQLKITADALERTLRKQLLTDEYARYYVKGDAKSACKVYVENPHIFFSQDRVYIDLHTYAQLGTGFAGKCLGITLSTNAEVSVLPDAQGENIGFRDARVEKISDSKELNFLLTPFLSHKVPGSMNVNAATLFRQLLTKSTETTGYKISLDRLKIHSMQIQNNMLVVDLDGDLSVH